MTKPTLYLFVGYPGAGKTTIAKIIAAKSGAEHLWADQERHQMFSNPTHSEAESLALYDHLNQRADSLLTDGHGVIYDTNFNFRADRQKLRDIAARHDALVRVIWVSTPKEVAKQRAVGQHTDGRNGYSVTMTDEQFETIAAKLEAPTEDENYLKIDGTKLDEQKLVRQLGL